MQLTFASDVRKHFFALFGRIKPSDEISVGCSNIKLEKNFKMTTIVYCSYMDGIFMCYKSWIIFINQCPFMASALEIVYISAQCHNTDMQFLHRQAEKLCYIMFPEIPEIPTSRDSCEGTAENTYGGTEIKWKRFTNAYH